VQISERPYRDREDLRKIGLLIRRAYAQVPHCNAWSFARFDIWAQRRIADERVHGRRDWQHGLRLWETERGALVGAVLFPSDQDAALILDPDQREMMEAMLTWAEARYARRDAAAEPLTIEAMESHTAQGQLLQSRGYVKLDGHYVHRQKPLDDDRIEPVVFPPGFAVKPIETLHEMRRFHQAVKGVFNFDDSVEVYQIVQQAPSYMPELDLIVLSAGGEVAAFCTAWLDADSGVAEFEPVGTVPDYRKQGLGAALMAEASNRLRSLGCRKAIVNSWSESAGANRLYAAAGLQAKDRIDSWQWKGL
jgi:GNAT superfamily N-acetyltransferase